MDRRPRGTPRSHASPLTTGDPSKSFEKRKRKSTRDSSAALLAELEARNPLPLPLNVSLAGRLRSHNETAMADARVSTEVAAVLEEMLRTSSLAGRERPPAARAGAAAKQATIDGLQAKLAEAEAKQEAEAAKERRGEAKKIREDLLSELWHLADHEVHDGHGEAPGEGRGGQEEDGLAGAAGREPARDGLERVPSPSARLAAPARLRVGFFVLASASAPPPRTSAGACLLRQTTPAAAAASSSSSSSSSAAAAPSNAPQLTEAPRSCGSGSWGRWVAEAEGAGRGLRPAARAADGAPSLQFSGAATGASTLSRLNAQQLIEYAGCSTPTPAHRRLVSEVLSFFRKEKKETYKSLNHARTFHSLSLSLARSLARSLSFLSFSCFFPSSSLPA